MNCSICSNIILLFEIENFANVRLERMESGADRFLIFSARFAQSDPISFCEITIEIFKNVRPEVMGSAADARCDH